MKTLAVDFDGVIHAYSRGWEDGRIYDEPKPGTWAALHELSGQFVLVVYTARDDLDPVTRWLVEHDLWQFVLEVTNRKPKAWAYIDDRAIRFESWAQALKQVHRLAPDDAWKPVLENKPSREDTECTAKVTKSSRRDQATNNEGAG